MALLCTACWAPLASHPKSEQTGSMGGYHGLEATAALTFLSLSYCFLLVMLVQRPKGTEVLGGNESGNLDHVTGGSVTRAHSAWCSLLPGALEEVIRLCNPQDNLLHILILLILPGEGCLCWVLYISWFLRINCDSSLWAHCVGGGMLGSLPALSEERGATEALNLSRAQQKPGKPLV